MNNIKNTIEWADKSWNPITGCLNGCSYCYARRIAHRFKRSFEPEFHEIRLLEPYRLNKPARIFCGSNADWFSDGVQPQWRETVKDVMRRSPRHTYFILTKRPDRISESFPNNCWVGVSVSDCRDIWRTDELKKIRANRKFVSIEPIMGLPSLLFFKFQWVIVGSMTGPKKIEPSKTSIEQCLRLANSEKTPLFMKKNVKPYYTGDLIQEYG